MEKKIVYNTLPKVNMPLRTFGLPFWYFFVFAVLSFVYLVLIPIVGILLIGLLIFSVKKCYKSYKNGKLYFFEDFISSLFTPERVVDSSGLLNHIIKK